MSEERKPKTYLFDAEVRVLNHIPPVMLVERIDGRPLDAFGRTRDWISASAITRKPQP